MSRLPEWHGSILLLVALSDQLMRSFCLSRYNYNIFVRYNSESNYRYRHWFSSSSVTIAPTTHYLFSLSDRR
jgi:hypothetical protein